MRAAVIKTFRDKITKEIYEPGTFVDMDDARIADLEDRGLVKAEKDEEPEEKPAKRRKSAKKRK